MGKWSEFGPSRDSRFSPKTDAGEMLGLAKVSFPASTPTGSPRPRPAGQVVAGYVSKRLGRAIQALIAV